MSRRGGVPGRAHDTIRPDVAELLRSVGLMHAEHGKWPWIYQQMPDRPVLEVVGTPHGVVARVPTATLNSARHLGLVTDRIGGWQLTPKGRRLAAATTKETT